MTPVPETCEASRTHLTISAASRPTNRLTDELPLLRYRG